MFVNHIHYMFWRLVCFIQYVLTLLHLSYAVGVWVYISNKLFQTVEHKALVLKHHFFNSRFKLRTERIFIIVGRSIERTSSCFFRSVL